MIAEAERDLDEDRDDVLALAEAQGVSLVLDQARIAVTAETAEDRMALLADILDAGTSDSQVRDRVCDGQVVSLRRWVKHCQMHPGRHQVDDVEVVLELVGPATPTPLPDDEIPAAVKRRQRARSYASLMDDPDVRRRMAGIGGEVYRPDDEES